MTLSDDTGTVVLQSLKISHRFIIPDRFYESLKLKNWVCELCTFSQIWSHISILYNKNSLLLISLYKFVASIYSFFILTFLATESLLRTMAIVNGTIYINFKTWMVLLTIYPLLMMTWLTICSVMLCMHMPHHSNLHVFRSW